MTKKSVRKSSPKKAPAKKAVKAKAPAAATRFVYRPIKARYDAAQTDPSNRSHWLAADDLGPNTANSRAVRRTLAVRARYERDNDPHLCGLTKTLAYDLIGTGPRLQLQSTAETYEEAKQIEQSFAEWCRAVNLTSKLRMMAEARPVDGESFALLVNGPDVPHPVKVDVRVIESEQVASPDALFDGLDGIEFDANGNPSHYHVLKEHPGDRSTWDMPYDRVPAKFVLHWFRPSRAGQSRGVSEFASSLPIGSQTRRYSAAVLSAAETAANIAGVMKTDMPPDTSDAPTVETMEEIDLPRAGLLTLPAGCEATAFKAEQPTGTYKEYVGEKRAEMGRAVLAPFNVITGNSSGYNYSSGRLDHVPYHRSVWIEREAFRFPVIDKIFSHWYLEARNAGLIPDSFVLTGWEWHWDGFDSIDPLKDTKANVEALKAGLLSWSEALAARGLRWREHFDQLAAERKYLTALGLDPDAMLGMNIPASSAATDTGDGNDAEDETKTDAHYRGKLRLSTGPDITFTEADCKVDIAAAEPGETPKPRRFSMVAYTGAAIRLASHRLPVVIDLAGVSYPGQSLPILRDHNPERLAGHTDKVDISAQRIRATGVLSGDGAEVGKLTATADNGFPWQASVGGHADRTEFVDKGQSVKVNGRNFHGPLVVVRAMSLREISFVPIGADGATSASIAAQYGGSVMDFDSWVKAKGFDPATLTDAQKEFLTAMFEAEGKPAPKPTPTPAPAPAPTGGTSDLEAALEPTRRENARRVEITTLVAKYAGDDPSKLDAFEKIGRLAIEGRWDVQKTEIELMRQARPNAPHVFVPTKPEVTGAVIEASVCKAGSLKTLEKEFDARTLEAADRLYRGGIGLQELIEVCAKPKGFRGHVGRNLRAALAAAFSPDIRADAATPSVLSIDGILSNVANKFVREAFNFVESDWRTISAIRSVRNFQQISTYSMTGDNQFVLVPPGGEIQHGTLGDETYNNQANTYAKMLGIDRRQLINDDLGALSGASRKLGRGAALKVNDVFWTAFMDNSSFFTAGRGNYDDGTDTALTDAGLKAAMIIWDALTDPDGKPMGTMAKFLLVPPGQWQPAMSLMNSTTVNSGGAALTERIPNSNPWAGMFTVVKSRYLANSAYTGYSALAWYLLCDPNDVPVIETVFLNGNESPTIETADLDFNRLGIALRGYFDFGVAKQEYRGGCKFKGEA